MGMTNVYYIISTAQYNMNVINGRAEWHDFRVWIEQPLHGTKSGMKWDT